MCIRDSLMMDRIIFLGAPIYDDAANIIQAQLLFLESVDPETVSYTHLSRGCCPKRK